MTTDRPERVEPIPDDIAEPTAAGMAEAAAEETREADALAAAVGGSAMDDGADDEPVIRRRRPMTPGEKSADSMLMSSAAARRIVREKTVDEALADTVRKFMAAESMGYFEVERIGPPSLPEPERGVLGEIRFIEIAGENASVSSILRERFGGGSYMLRAKRSDNSDGEVNPVRMKISGDPIPVSEIGRSWLHNAKRRGRLEEDAGYAPSGGGGDQSAQIFALMMKMMETQEERARVEREREREQRRIDEDRRRDAEKAAAEAAAKREADRLAEEKARREREREDEKARRAQEMELFQQRMDAQMKMLEADAQARIRAIEMQAEMQAKRAEAQLKMDMMRAESSATSGLGIEGLSKLRTTLAEAMGKKLTEDLGLNVDEEDNSFGAIVGGAAKEVLPDLLRTAGESLLPKLAGLIPDRGGVPAPAAAPALPGVQPVQALPGPAGPALEPVDEPDADEGPAGPGGAPAGVPAIPPVPSLEVRRKQAQMLAIRSVLQFSRPLSVILLARPDPAAAWGEDIGNDRTLADAYAGMTEQARSALAGPDGWPKFLGMLSKFAPDDAKALEEGAAIEGGDTWVAAFLASGPWTDEETDQAAPAAEPAK